MRDQDLESLFAEARAEAPMDSGPLVTRVLADADLHLPRARQTVQGRLLVLQHKAGFWAMLTEAIGGRGVFAGLATVALAGVMVGYVQPASLSSLTASIFVQSPLDEVDLFPGVDALLIEG